MLFRSVWMAGFHLSFDLNTFHLLHPAQNFYRDPFWTLQRVAIVSLFLLCAGLGQAIALHAGQRPARFWRRWAQVAGCALLVSVGSALMFPRSWISFGVLHGIALMLLLSRAAWRLPLPALPVLALACIALPPAVQHPLFDSRWTNWVGLVTHKPVTEDYVPLLPWTGVMLLGLAAGRAALAHGGGVLQGSLPPWLKPLATLGRWPLSFYMLHQPVFIGTLMGWRWLQQGA